MCVFNSTGTEHRLSFKTQSHTLFYSELMLLLCLRIAISEIFEGQEERMQLLTRKKWRKLRGKKPPFLFPKCKKKG